MSVLGDALGDSIRTNIDTAVGVDPTDRTGVFRGMGNAIYEGLALGDNSIINGAFWINQEAASYGTTGVEYTLDGFEYVRTGNARHLITQSTDVPSWAVTQFSLSAKLTTRDGGLGSNDRTYFTYHIEGYDFRKYVSQSATLSFNVKSGLAGIYCICFQNSTHDRAYIVEYTIDSADTWQAIEIPITLTIVEGPGIL